VSSKASRRARSAAFDLPDGADRRRERVVARTSYGVGWPGLVVEETISPFKFMRCARRLRDGDLDLAGAAIALRRP